MVDVKKFVEFLFAFVLVAAVTAAVTAWLVGGVVDGGYFWRFKVMSAAFAVTWLFKASIDALVDFRDDRQAK